MLLGGGSSVVQRYLAAGHIDKFELHTVPLLVGTGGRLFDGVGDLELEQLRLVEAPVMTHIKYGVIR